VMMDERTGQIADYRARDGVLDSFIIAPDNAPAWVQARTWLWNRAEAAEHRANGRLATELELALPHELDAAARKRLLKDFLAPIIERYGVAADVAIHEPGEGRDHRNIHAHVLITNRRIDENGFIEKAEGQRKDIGMSGFGRSSEAVIEIRQQWEQHVNLAYERAGLDIRVDHRSHSDRGIEQEPTTHLGPTAAAMERRGEPSDRGDINREITARNEALRERAQLEVEAVKVAAELSAAKMLAEMERRDWLAAETIQQDYANAAGRRDEIQPNRSAEIDRQADQTMQQQWTAARGRVDDVRAPIFDRDAASRAADEKIIDAAIQADQEARAAARGRKDDIRGPQDTPTARGSYADLPQPDYAAAKGRVDDIKPALGKTAGEIRMAFSLSRSASELQEGLAAHGISLALTSAEEARQSERTAAFAKEVGSFARVLREGEIVAVNGSGHVYRLDEHTTGQTRNEVEGRLTWINHDELLNITDTKEAMQEASRAAWIDRQRAAQEQNRPPSLMESRIADCAEQARNSGAIVQQDAEGRRVSGAEALADYFRPEDERKTRVATIHGPEALTARLDEAGIAIARVTETDIEALAALRHGEDMARIAAETNNETRKPHHFAADLVVGDIAAVTRDGDVYRINPKKIGDGKQFLAADLPGVVETRARLEIDREQIAALWQERRADAAATRQDIAAERESQAQHAETLRNVHQFNQDVGEAVDTGQRAAGGFMRGLSQAVENFLESLSDFLAPAPPPTKDQAERMARSAEETAQANEQTAQHTERAEAQHWLVEEARRRAAQEREEAERAKTAAELYGTPRAQEWDDEHDRGRERERER
jgi:MobA/MobL family